MYLIVYICLICIILNVLWCKAEEDFLEKPSNVAGKLGQIIELKCAFLSTTIKSGTFWTRTGDSVPISADKEVFYDDYSLSESSDDTVYNLQINSAAMKHAGMYHCIWIFGSSSTIASAEVIVVGESLVCTNNITGTGVMDGDYVLFTCSLDYSGFSAPLMHWSSQLRGISTAVEATSYEINASKNVVSRLIFQAWSEDNERSYGCRTYFNMSSNVQSVNVPFRSAPITVYYPPKGIAVSPLRSIYYPGEVIVISANGNPSARYRWVDENTGEVIESEKLFILQSRLGSHRYKAVAYNDHGNESKIISFTIAVPTTPTPTTTTTTTTTTTITIIGSTRDGSTTLAAIGELGSSSGLGSGAIAGIAVGVIVLLLVIIVISYVICKRRTSLPTDGPYNINADKPGRENAIHGDQVRQPDVAFPGGPPPPQYTVNDETPRNLDYQNLALDDTPRSRKPILTFEPQPAGHEYSNSSHAPMYG